MYIRFELSGEDESCFWNDVLCCLYHKTRELILITYVGVFRPQLYTLLIKSWGGGEPSKEKTKSDFLKIFFKDFDQIILTLKHSLRRLRLKQNLFLQKF